MTALDKLREKMNETDIGGGNDAMFWNIPDGDSTIRILPPVGDMDYFFQEVGSHYLPDNSHVYCPHFTTNGEYACPICEIATILQRSRIKDDRDTASKFRVRKKYWMGVIVRELTDTEGITGEGPFVFTPGPTIMKQIQSLIMSSDYGDPSLATPTPDGGYDIVINRKGKKLDTEYNVNARRHSFPLHPNPIQVTTWLDTAIEINVCHLTDNPDDDAKVGDGFLVRLMPYERIVVEHGISPDMDVDAYLSTAPTSRSGGRQANTTSLKDRLHKSPKPQVADESSQPVSEDTNKRGSVSISPKEEPDSVGSEIKQRRQRRSRNT